MNNLIYILYAVVLIWSLYDIWKSSMDQGKKILWTIICVLLGLIGSIIYILAGRKK